MAKVKDNDELIVSALIECGTVKAAAAKLKMSERSIFDRMNNGEFKTIYSNAKADILRSTVYSLNGQIQAAIETVVEVMTDKENSPNIRLQAAQTILTHAGKLANRLQMDESSITAQAESNRFPIY